ncbi:hypothetical protein [Streptomyces canus]|nr:hypothetical protein [Streptomyces canus]
MKSFEGSLNGKAGAFNFAHSATTLGTARTGRTSSSSWSPAAALAR